MIPRYVTQDRARAVVGETYEEAIEEREDVGALAVLEAPQWVCLSTGWLPLWLPEHLDGRRASTLWNLILEHGRTYTQHLQKFEGPPESHERQRREALKRIGGGMPF